MPQGLVNSIFVFGATKSVTTLARCSQEGSERPPPTFPVEQRAIVGSPLFRGACVRYYWYGSVEWLVLELGKYRMLWFWRGSKRSFNFFVLRAGRLTFAVRIFRLSPSGSLRGFLPPFRRLCVGYWYGSIEWFVVEVEKCRALWF